MTHQAKIEPTPEVLAANKRFQESAKHDRRRLKVANAADAVDWQERHDPTEPVAVKVANRVEVAQGIVTRRVLTQERCRVRKTEAQLLAVLDVDQISAMEAIYSGWCFAHGNVSVGVAKYGVRTDAGTETAESSINRRTRLEAQYHEWGRKCRAEGIEVSPILQIIIYGHSLRAVCAARKSERGKCDSNWAKANLVYGLDLYRKLFRAG